MGWWVVVAIRSKDERWTGSISLSALVVVVVVMVVKTGDGGEDW